MSILWTLRKFTDAIAHREEEASQQRDRKLARRQALADGDDDPPPSDQPQRQRRYECRVCGYRSADEKYCAQCLADTMAPCE